jgi:glyoxylase-like metal-dependent hydrolase (beta-lactamase superfamily II)
MNADAQLLASPPPPIGETREVAPGILWIRMPMPFQLDHANLWAIRDDRSENSWTIVDAGLNTPETIEVWRRLLNGPGPLGGAAISRVIVSHMHPDHLGLAGWLTREFSCELWMSEREYIHGRAMQAEAGRTPSIETVRFYRAAGWSEEEIETYRARYVRRGDMICRMPQSYRRLQDDDLVRIGGSDWRVIVGRGHSPEHACLYCEELKLFISGDQILPSISSNVSVHAIEPCGDPLGDWLHSIETMKRQAPDDVVVLPGHNAPFLGLHRRLDQLADGHIKALDRLMDLLRTPRRVVDAFDVLFARRVTPESGLLELATGESLAHINYLLRRDKVVIERIVDGVALYARRTS